MARKPRSLAACLVILFGAFGPHGAAEEVGRDATRTLITVFEVEGGTKRVILDAPRRFESPEWSPDGSYLLLNAGGRLWRLAADGSGPPRPATGETGWVDVNHGLSPDGRTLAVTDTGSLAISLAPIDPASNSIAIGKPRRIGTAPSYFQAWAPDSKSFAFAANRGSGIDLFAMNADGGAERRLTSHAGHDDYPDYSADGLRIFFNSDRSGGSDIWEMPVEGAGPGDSRARRLTTDGREDWSPHPSPDGKALIFLSYPKGTAWHPADRDVVIRRTPLAAVPGKPSRVEPIVRFVGGHGSLGPRPWSPDGRRFAFARFQPPASTVRVVFFTPSDLGVPDGVPHRLGRVAEAAEGFLVDGMRRWGYAPAVKHPFRRNGDGSPEILYVKGDRPAAAGVATGPETASDIIRRATQQYKIPGDKNLWWIFIYVGDRPVRFSDWRGSGRSWDGGWSLVNYDAIPGEIRRDLGLQQGFNAEFALKGVVHELCHAFGLPHVGPDPALGRGNSLMGPNNDVYAGRGLPHADRVYLTAGSAAMLWKHPVFSGEAADRFVQPTAKLLDFKRTYEPVRGRVTLRGRLKSDRPAHSVVVWDDLGRPDDEYWRRVAAARIAADGTFQVAIEHPAQVDGRHRIVFCFENGMIVGDDDKVASDGRGEIVKSYRYRNGRYQFLD